MSEQIADGYVGFTILSELWNVFCDRIVDLEPSLLFQLHNSCRGRDNFSQRRQIEDCVRCHGLDSWFERAAAVRFAVDDLPIMSNKQDCAGSFMIVNRGLNDGINNAQIMGGLLCKERSATDEGNYDCARSVSMNHCKSGDYDHSIPEFIAHVSCLSKLP